MVFCFEFKLSCLFLEFLSCYTVSVVEFSGCTRYSVDAEDLVIIWDPISFERSFSSNTPLIEGWRLFWPVLNFPTLACYAISNLLSCLLLFPCLKGTISDAFPCVLSSVALTPI